MPIATLRFPHARYSVSANRTPLGSLPFAKRLESPVVRHDMGLATYTNVEGQSKVWFAQLSNLTTPLNYRSPVANSWNTPGHVEEFG